MFIPFAELRDHNNSESFVWTGLVYNPEEKDEIEGWLKEVKFLPPDASIKEMRKISGNVKGDGGRTDVLFITEPTKFDPLVRLSIDGLKWTSDYIDNYGSDYGVE